jgi:hypothetical protein
MFPKSPSAIATVIVLLLVVGSTALLWWFTTYVRGRRDHALRPIPAFQTLRGLLGRAAESGKQVHVSVGSSGLGDDQTAAASAGLTALRYLADQGAAFGYAPIVTVADPMLMLVAQDVIHRAYERMGFAESYDPTTVRMIAPDATAYAVGAQDAVDDESVAANVMIGHLGDEYLLVGEAGAQREITQVAASNAVNAQPFVAATTEQPLLGEEAFAAGAYLGRRPEHVASLYVQDVLRLLIVVAIVIGVLIKTVSR